MAVAKFVRQDSREHDPVLQRVTAPGRRLRAIGEHPPLAVGRASEIDGVEMQIDFLRNAQAVARAEKSRIREDERGRKQPIPQQSLRTVQIRENQIEAASRVA